MISIVLGLILVLAQAKPHHHTDILLAQFSVDLEDSVAITTDKTRLHHSSEWVAVSWSGLSHPQPNDWIGLYSPANVDVKETAPIKLKWASSSDTHLKTGSGTLLFSVLNMRSDLRFVMFRGGVSAPVKIAESKVISFDNANEPVSAHLSITDETPRQLRLSWASLNTENPTVQYWIDDKKHESRGHSVTYTREEMCGPPASGYGWREPGTIHHAVLTGLKPSTTFQYRYGSDETGWSHIMTGRVPPESGHDHVTFYTFGDLGIASPDGALQPFWTQPASRKSTDFMARNVDAADFVLHIGDISYAVGFQASWDIFMNQVAPIAQALPYQVAIGNHERDYEHSHGLFESDDSGGECGVPYQRQFPIPSGSFNQTWYSMESGPVHILVMSTEHSFHQGSDQYAFIENDLKNVDRQRTPWVIVAGHRPMYVDTAVDVFGEASEKFVSEMLRNELEDLLVETKVDLALWGHDHSYQRSCPVYATNCVDGSESTDGYPGLIHLVVGSAGMDLSPDGAKVPPGWLLNRVDDYGIGLIKASKTRLLFQFISDETEQVLDEILLQKKQPGIIQDQVDIIDVAIA